MDKKWEVVCNNVVWGLCIFKWGKNLNLVLLLNWDFKKYYQARPPPTASVTMMILWHQMKQAVAFGEKKAEDVDKFDLIRLQTNQMATVQSLKRTSQSMRVKDNIKWKNPHSYLIKGLIFKPW